MRPAGPRSADSQPANGQEQSQEEVSGQEDAAKTAESNETAGETSENGSEEEVSAEDEAETPANSGNTNAPAEPAKQPEQETQKPANEQPPAEAQKPEETAKPAEPEKPTEPEIVYQYKNGTFSGSGEGFEGTITVNVTIENDKITNISVVSASDDEPYWSESKGIISRIISAQSANVDTVSGATFSSGGILDAVKAALSSAKN